MKNNVFFNRWTKYWLLLWLIIMVQIIFAWNAVIKERNTRIVEVKNNAEKNIKFFQAAIREKLQNKEYVSAGQFLKEWGESHSHRISTITLTTANGFVLGHYQSTLKPTHFFSLTNTIPYSYHHPVTLRLVINLDSAFKHSSGFAMTLAGFICLCSLFLIVTTWLYIRQKKLSLHLQNSEEKYRTLAENAPDLRYRIDIEGKIIFVSQSAYKLSGYTAEEATGMNILEIYATPEDREFFLTALQKDGHVDNFVVQLKRKDDSLWWGSLNAQFYKDQAGNILGIDGVVRDVTEQKLAQIKLEESDARLNSIFRAAPAGIGVVVDRVITEANDRLCEMVDYRQEDLLGKSSRVLYHTDEEYELVGREKYRLISEQGTGTLETIMQRKDGSLVDVLLSSTPLDLDDLSAGVTFTATDITMIKDTENRLRRSENKFRSMMESMSDPVYICSDDYHVEYMNPAMIKRTGRDASGDFCYKALHDFDQQCPWCNNKADFRGKFFESDIISPKDNHAYHVSHSPIVNEDGSVSNMTIFRDVTDLKRLESQLLQAQKMESLGTLAGGIAHDFNNILAAILGFSEMALHDLPDGSKAKKDIDRVIASGRRATDLVQQILTFSRKEPQRLNLFNPHLIVKEALKMLGSSLPTTIMIEADLDSECGKIQADPTQIHQIVMNLCTNAFQSMEDQKGIIKIQLQRAEITGEEIAGEPKTSVAPFIVLSVSDTGYGMDQATKERIFEPYFTTKETGKGTGLGLAVIHGIVESCKGFIKVESEPEQGTTFHIYLPVMENNVVSPLSETEKADSPPTGTEHIMVIDDEDDILNLYETVLKRLGYKVTPTTDSLVALEKIRTHPDRFDLIVTDQSMPNLSGGELAREVLKIKPTMPIILCTGYSSIVSEKDAIVIGIKKYVTKPLELKELATIVRQVLDES